MSCVLGTAADTVIGAEKLTPSVELTPKRLEVVGSNQTMVMVPLGDTASCAAVAPLGFTGAEKVTPPFVERLKKLPGTVLVDVRLRCQRRLMWPVPSRPIWILFCALRVLDRSLGMLTGGTEKVLPPSVERTNCGPLPLTQATSIFAAVSVAITGSP